SQMMIGYAAFSSVHPCGAGKLETSRECRDCSLSECTVTHAGHADLTFKVKWFPACMLPENDGIIIQQIIRIRLVFFAMLLPGEQSIIIDDVFVSIGLIYIVDPHFGQKLRKHVVPYEIPFFFKILVGAEADQPLVILPRLDHTLELQS